MICCSSLKQGTPKHVGFDKLVCFNSLNRLGLTKTHIKEALIDKPSNIKCGRKLTPLDTRKQVWNYWHNKTTHSTLTSSPAKLKIIDRCKIQSDLQLVDTNIIVQRGKHHYESNWRMVNIH